jgi:hypothetical protein
VYSRIRIKQDLLRAADIRVKKDLWYTKESKQDLSQFKFMQDHWAMTEIKIKQEF